MTITQKWSEFGLMMAYGIGGRECLPRHKDSIEKHQGVSAERLLNHENHNGK